MSALIALDGVLRTETGDPIPDGIKLYRILAESYRVIISSDLSPALTEHWLKSNMIVGFGDIFNDTHFYVGQDLRTRHIDIAKAQGKLELFVDSGADHCAYALSLGIPTVMYANPTFVRTTRIIKPWADLQAEVDRQKEAILNTYTGSSVKNFE